MEKIFALNEGAAKRIVQYTEERQALHLRENETTPKGKKYYP